MNKNKKLLLFDLDGVILNSKDNMMLSWHRVQNEFSIKIPFEDYFNKIGRPFNEIMDLLELSERSKEIEDVYKEASIANLDKLSFFEGVKSTLTKLISLGYQLGIVTSKDEMRTQMILDKLGVDFLIVQTPNSMYRGKPAPDHLLVALAITQTDPSEAIYIGDMEVDYLAALRGGVDYLHAEWGYSKNFNTNVTRLASISEIISYVEGAKK